MWEKLRRQIEKIQNSDETIKRRWLVGMTALAMVLVITLWLLYMNFTIKSISFSQNDFSQNQDHQTGSWEIFKTGLSITISSIKTEVQNFIFKITSERKFIIEGSDE